MGMVKVSSHVEGTGWRAATLEAAGLKMTPGVGVPRCVGVGEEGEEEEKEEEEEDEEEEEEEEGDREWMRRRDKRGGQSVCRFRG